MGTITNLNCITRLDLPVERILNGIDANELDSIVVLGWDKEGQFYFASSLADGAEVNWLLDKGKQKLLSITE